MVISASSLGNRSQRQRLLSQVDESLDGRPTLAHFLGDDSSPPMDSNVGPTGFVPAAGVVINSSWPTQFKKSKTL